MKFGWVFFLVVILAACGSKKNSGDTGVMEVKDFLALFKTVKLPYSIGDTSFNKLSSDTPVINSDLFAHFVGDSVLGKNFGTTKPKIYPTGRVSAKKAETYLFAKAISGTRKVAYL